MELILQFTNNLQLRPLVLQVSEFDCDFDGNILIGIWLSWFFHSKLEKWILAGLIPFSKEVYERV